MQNAGSSTSFAHSIHSCHKYGEHEKSRSQINIYSNYLFVTRIINVVEVLIPNIIEDRLKTVGTFSVDI